MDAHPRQLFLLSGAARGAARAGLLPWGSRRQMLLGWHYMYYYTTPMR
jgi:hypothetical protein